MQKPKKSFRNKRGSSLPMVVAIGLVLVIWTMSLSPIVATQGKASIDVQNQEEDYLQSRSAIEFTKGELLNMVTLHGIPETFAVTYDGGVFTPKAWDDPDYGTYVSAQPSDLDDIPLDTENGKKVAAICAVEKPVGEKDYTIQVTTFNQGEANLTYNTTYTPPVISKMIYPEAYKKTQALPLSDFVLVDGKLGRTTVWESSLTDGTFNHTNYFSKNDDKFSAYKETFIERLLPTTENATSGSYHAVFKVTAEATERVEPNYRVPPTEGVDAMRVEPLPAPSLSIVSSTRNGSQIEVVLSSSMGEHTVYGCSQNANGSGVTWQTSNVFRLTHGGSYYFYGYAVGYSDDANKVIYTNSSVSVATGSPVQILDFKHDNHTNSIGSDNSKSYIVYAKNGGTYTYVKGRQGLTPGNSSNLTTETIAEGLCLVDTNMLWKVSGNNKKTLIYDSSRLMFDTSDLRNFKFKLDSNGSELNYSSDRLYYDGIFGYYYLDILGGGNFYSHREKNVYFFPVNNAAAPNGTPSIVSVTQKDFPIGVDGYEYGTTLASVTSDVRAYLISQVGTVENVEVHFDYRPTTDSMSAGYYKVYCTWEKNSIPYFAQLGTVTIKSEEVPDYGSGISGRALYFMAEDHAFDTKGSAIHLKTDLLVIRSKLVAAGDSGSVILNPYSTSDTLVFFKNGSAPFKAYNFYRVPAGTNLMSVTDEQAAAWLVRDNSGECVDGSKVTYAADGVTATSIVFPDKVIILESSSDFSYPVINFDIAYASAEQLAYVVSGEAAKWTVDGVMKSSSSTPNGMYVICPYVTEIQGNVDRSANRILISTGSGNFTVPETMQLYSRYLSIDAPQIVQGGSSSSFKLRCLVKNDSFWEDVGDWLDRLFGGSDYNSNTLQVDYEQTTTIVLKDGSSSEPIEPQICRYEDGTNLFNSTTPAEEQLRVSYTTDDINDVIYYNGLFDYVTRLTIIERYMDISEGSDGVLNFDGSDHTRELSLFTNYVSFDSSITEIVVKSGWLTRGDFVINSQESGYTQNEYLSLFHTSSAETYTGTLLYFEDDVLVNRGGHNNFTIEGGFYFVPATTNGTSILDIRSYKITKEELNAYCKYINEDDGSMGSAFVDAGFSTNEASEGGFGGGSVK